MTAPVFLHASELTALAYEHGFGTDLSDGVVPERTSTVTQVHGTDLARAPVAADVRADALFTTEPGHAVAVRTADCVPILLAHERGWAAAAVHAGWRGSAAGISGLVVGQLCAATQSTPDDWIALVGPHIDVCCYEVDGPVLDAVASPGVFRDSPKVGHAYLDLFALNAQGLARAGVKRISRLPGCTRCDARFSSFRRDRTQRRMLSYIRVSAEARRR